MKIINYLFILGAIITAASCNKIGQGGIPSSSSIVNVLTKGIPTKFDIVISLDKTQTKSNSSISYGFFGNFNSKNIGTISLNNVALAFNGQSTNYSLTNGKDSSMLKGKENQYFGLTNNIKVGDNSYSMYVPKIITNTFKNCNVKGDFVKANGIAINWVVDNSNLSNPVVIVLEYSPTMGRNEDLFPTTKIIAKQYTAKEDAGTYTIPASELSDFPIGCMPTIHIARGNALTTNDGKNILSFNVTHNTGRLIL